MSIKVGVEIEACDVMITSIGQCVKLWVDDASVSEEAGFDGIPNSLQSSTKISSLSFVKLLSNSANSSDILTKDEHVLNTDFFGNLNVGTVHGSNNESTIHDEFHV